MANPSAQYVRTQEKVLDVLKTNKGKEFTVSDLAKQVGLRGRKTVLVSAATRGFAGDSECPVRRVVRSGKPAFVYGGSAPKAAPAPKPEIVIETQTVDDTSLHLIPVIPADGEVVFADASGKAWLARPLSV